MREIVTLHKFNIKFISTTSLFTMRAILLSLLSLVTASFPVCGFAQTKQSATSFVIDNNKYYLHQISHHDLSGSDLEIGSWNQNIVADNQYIYIADHTDNASDHLTIKRYNAINGLPADNLVISEKELIKYDIDLETDEYERCFSLVNCNNDSYFILLINVSPDKNLTTGSKIKFYLVDKEGTLERQFICTTSNIDYSFMKTDISDFGIPVFVGDVSEGNFEMLLPMVNGINYMTVINFSFKDFKQIGCYSVFSDYSQTKRYTKPTIQIVDGSFFIIDDIGILPTLYSYKFSPNQIYGQLNDNHINAHGCNSFDFDNHRLLYSGDIHYDSDDAQNGITRFNIGLWDKIEESVVASRANPTASFDNYTHLASIDFGPSTINTKELYPYTYRQFMAVSDYGNSTKHLHFYVPGEFLATYQLNKYDIPTGVNDIIGTNEAPDINYHITDNNITFDCPVTDIYIFNITGRQIFHSEIPVKSINLANFVKGTYIVATPQKSFKIIL